MKYMTKQWYRDMQAVTILPHDLCVDPWAERYSESCFRKLYAQKKSQWLALRSELMADWGEPFDSEAETSSFARNYRDQKRRLLLDLPKEILNRVADIRVLALGFCTEEIYSMCNAYVKNRMQSVDDRIREYKTYAELELKDVPFELAYFHDGVVKSLRRKSNSLVLEFDDPEQCLSHNRIAFNNAVVMQQDGRLCGAEWLYSEIYKNTLGYEIHALLHRNGKQLDFIVQCSDVEMGNYTCNL